METYWSGQQVARIVGISYDVLDYWVKKGLITPDSHVSESQKRQKVSYSFSNIVAIAAIKALRDKGISLQRLKKAQTEFCQRIGLSFEQGLRGGIIVADGNEILVVLYTFDEAVEVMSLLKGGQLILPLDNIINNVSQKVETLFRESESYSLPIRSTLQEVKNGR
jgi:DNA-binding transcriptional MerR regulator